MARTFAGLCAEPPAVEGAPRREPGDNPARAWLQQWQRLALAAGAGGLPVWFDMLPGGPGDRPTYTPQGAACSFEKDSDLLWPKWSKIAAYDS